MKTPRLVLAALAILFLFSLSWANKTTITSLPYTASMAGTNYSETLEVQGTMLSSTGSGINFTGHDIVLRLVSDTLRFGTSGGDSYYGINFTNAYRIRIEGGLIKHGTTDDVACWGITAIKFSGSPHDIRIKNTNVKVSGDNAHCVDSYGGGTGIYNIEISGGRYWDYGHGYDNRCSYDGAALRFESGNNNGIYNAAIHNIYLMTGPGQGLVISGRSTSLGRYLVYSCSLVTDHRNTTYAVDDGDVCHNSANPYAIHARFIKNPSKITGNIIRSGSTYGGNRGIMLENTVGVSTQPVSVSYNDVNIHEGPNVHYGDSFACFGIRVRDIDGGITKYLNVYNNMIIVSGDSIAGTASYSQMPIACNYSNDNPGTGSHVGFSRNTFSAYRYSGTGHVESRAVVFDLAAGDPTFIFTGNLLMSDDVIVKWGDYNVGYAKNLKLEKNTLRRITPAQSGAATYLLGHLGNNMDCTGNKVVDITYQNGASDTNITFSTAGTADLYLQRKITPTIKGWNNYPVGGATVYFTDVYGHTKSATTNAKGMATGYLPYWFESRTATDTLNFNDYTIKAKAGSDSTMLNYTVTKTSAASPTIILQNTEGDPLPPFSWGDSYTPAW